MPKMPKIPNKLAKKQSFSTNPTKSKKDPAKTEIQKGLGSSRGLDEIKSGGRLKLIYFAKGINKLRGNIFTMDVSMREEG